MINVHKARELFDAKMQYVEAQLGYNPKNKLVMSVGPDDASVIYEQMFVCFYAGMEAQQMEHFKNGIDL